jgi:competence protein ComEC
VLLTGDIEPEAQRALLNSVPPLDVDVAKIPHHGSANQHPRFPPWSRAEVAVVSSGAGNDYGHPSDLTMGTWQAAGASVLRTDERGDVIAVGVPGGPPTIVTRTVAAGS